MSCLDLIKGYWKILAVDMKGGCLNVSSPIAAAPGKGQIYRKI